MVIVLYKYLQEIDIDSNKRNLLIFPLVSLISFGIFLHFIEFKYITQYITVCGPILGALVAIYVADSNNERANLKEKDKRVTQLEHTKLMLQDCQKVIQLELNNYDKLIKNVTNSLSAPPNLSSTPFYFLTVLANTNQTELYSSILESQQSTPADLKEAYLKISKNITNALFAKSISDRNYPEFNARYNLYAEKWVSNKLKLNELYRKNRDNPSSNNNFNTSLADFVQNYNQEAAKGNIDGYSMSDQRYKYLEPLIKVVVDNPTTDPIIADFISTIEILKITLEKMAEMLNELVQNYQDLHKQLSEILEEIQSNYERI